MKEIQRHLTEVCKKVLNDLQKEKRRNIDYSKLDTKYIKNLLKCISRCEFEVDILLTITQEIGGFGSSYPKSCLESLKTMKTILEMELKRFDN